MVVLPPKLGIMPLCQAPSGFNRSQSKLIKSLKTPTAKGRGTREIGGSDEGKGQLEG